MNKYTKIQEEVDAVQWFKDGDHNAVLYCRTQKHFTLHGGHSKFVSPGDWVVNDENGKLSVVSDKKFRRTYVTCAGSTDEKTNLASAELENLGKYIEKSLEIKHLEKQVEFLLDMCEVVQKEYLERSMLLEYGAHGTGDKEDTDAVIIRCEDLKVVRRALIYSEEIVDCRGWTFNKVKAALKIVNEALKLN